MDDFEKKKIGFKSRNFLMDTLEKFSVNIFAYSLFPTF
jgi:hypothetical protein